MDFCNLPALIGDVISAINLIDNPTADLEFLFLHGPTLTGLVLIVKWAGCICPIRHIIRSDNVVLLCSEPCPIPYQESARNDARNP